MGSHSLMAQRGLIEDEVFGYQVERIEPKLRQYQRSAVCGAQSSLRRHSRTLLVMPTGSGKTITACFLLREHLAQGGQSAWFLAPRRELVYQTCGKLEELGVRHAMLMAGERMDLSAEAQVASIPTLARRLETGLPVDPPSLIIVDEAHAAFGAQTRRILESFPDAKVLGMTATPARADGRGLGELYEDLVEGPSVRDLMDEGHLVPVRYFAPDRADLDGVRVTAGDYNERDLAQRMNTPKLVGDVVENWKRIASDRQTVVFAVERSHAMALHEEFISEGVRSEYIDGNTENDERAAILRRIRSGESQVICSVDVLSYGWDEPSISCGILARPTKSVARYLQSAGRILRPAGGKTDAILIDHGGAVEDFGFLDDARPWSLDSSSKIQDRMERRKRETRDASEVVTSLTCPSCKAEIRPQPKCPECGAAMSRQWSKAIEAVEAELREIKERETAQQKRESAEARKRAREWLFGPEGKGELIAQLKGYAQTKGYKPGWAYYKFVEIHGEDPPKPEPRPSEPSPAVKAWVKAQIIRAQKAKLRREA